MTMSLEVGINCEFDYLYIFEVYKTWHELIWRLSKQIKFLVLFENGSVKQHSDNVFILYLFS